MYNSYGLLNRHEFMSSRNFSTKLPTLTKRRLNLLEETKVISIFNKIEILEIYNCNRLLTEQEISQDKSDMKNDLAKLYKALGLFYFLSDKKSRFTNQFFDFFIICANEATYEYMKKFEYDINDYELGLMYGYHPKSILAFNHLISRQDGLINKSSHMYFNSKVFSVDFLEEEDLYHRQIWEQLRKLSPKIIAEAEDYFAEKQSKQKST